MEVCVKQCTDNNIRKKKKRRKNEKSMNDKYWFKTMIWSLNHRQKF